jgi:hypothetical protein
LVAECRAAALAQQEVLQPLFDELGPTFKPDLRDDLIDEAVERLHVFNRDLECDTPVGRDS